jgi:predicted transcriptional regulator
MLNVLLKDAMTQGYLYVEEHQAAGKAMKVMRDMHISSVFVMRYDRPVGVITERKIIEKAVQGVDLFTATAKDVMSSPVIQLSVDNTVGEACKLMKEKEFRHLAVVDDTGYLKGTITSSNIVNLMGSESFSSIAQVKDVMYPNVVIGEKDSILKDIALELLELRTCCAIVMSEDTPVGIVSEKDITNCIGFGHNLSKVKLEKIMSAPVIGIHDKDSVAQAIITLRRHRIHRLVCYNYEGQVSGILALGGLARNIEKVLN